MPITINGSGTLTGLSAGGLPDASITSDDIAAGAVTAAKLAAGAGGKMIQYARSSGYSTQESTTSTSWINTSFTATFTPTSASNKVVIVISSLNITTRDGYTTHVDLARTVNSTTTQLGTTAGYSAGIMTPYSSSYMDTTNLLFYQDEPATTSQITYRVVWKTDGGGNARYIFRANQAAYMHFFEVGS